MLKEQETIPIKPRGSTVELPHGGLPEVFSPYLADLIKNTGGKDGPIGKQFVANPELERMYYAEGLQDPLMEDHNEVAPGLVYKYQAIIDEQGNVIKKGRALWTITRNCAAYCRFCTRGREVGIKSGQHGEGNSALSYSAHLSKEDIDASLSFISQTKGLNEIILSGGDPLTVNPKVLTYVLGRLGEIQQEGKLKIVRLGTRVPVHNPHIVNEKHIDALRLIKNPRLMVHINHPWELTDQTKEVLSQLRTEGRAIVMSQSVLLQGVNDDPKILRELFEQVSYEGGIPYYLFQNDAVYWARHFTVPIGKAIHIWQSIFNEDISGVARTAKFVIDVPKGYGKVPVPEGKWHVDYEKGFIDFKGNWFPLEYDEL